jgi:hypothetical protein
MFLFQAFPKRIYLCISIRAIVASVPLSSLPNLVALFQGSLEVRLPTIWTDAEKRRERVRKEVRRKKIKAGENVKLRNTVFSNVLWLRRVKKVVIAVAVPAGFDDPTVTCS